MKKLIIVVGVLIVVVVLAYVVVNQQPAVGRVCIVDEKGNCIVDITKQYQNRTSDVDRECTQDDEYFQTTRYICVRSSYSTWDPVFLARGGNEELTTYFTEIDGNTYILNARDVQLQDDHEYLITALEQKGYCIGPGKIIGAEELNSSCDGRSTCHGIPMGFPGGNATVEVC